MNRIFKSVWFCASVAVSVVIVSLFQSCNNDSEEMLDVKTESVMRLEYLNCPDNMSPKEELNIIDQAFQRLGDHFIIEDDTCYLTVYSGKGMNISDAVFGLVERTVKGMNAQYKAYLFFKDNDMGISIRNPFELKLPVITTKAQSETTSGPQFVTRTVSLSHSESITVLNEMRNANGHAGNLAGAVAGIVSTPVAGALVYLNSVFTDSTLAGIQDEYARSNSTRGITLEATYMWSPTTGMGYTTYRYTINR